MLLNFLLGKLSKEYYPEVNFRKCIRAYSLPESCTKCKELCPKDAIKFKLGKIEFDRELCSKCGTCRAICPTHAIVIKDIGEKNILHTIRNKKNLIFSCTNMNSIGNLRLNCLNGLHSELLATFFILFKDKRFFFNLSKCHNCHINNNNYVFLSSLKSAENFVRTLGIIPQYEIIKVDENKLYKLLDHIISRKELFSILKKESRDLLIKTIDKVTDDKGNQLPIREFLLSAIGETEYLKEVQVTLEKDTFFASWNITESCNGCGL